MLPRSLCHFPASKTPVIIQAEEIQLHIYEKEDLLTTHVKLAQQNITNLNLRAKALYELV
jgi:hypothetical protein